MSVGMTLHLSRLSHLPLPGVQPCPHRSVDGVLGQSPSEEPQWGLGFMMKGLLALEVESSSLNGLQDSKWALSLFPMSEEMYSRRPRGHTGSQPTPPWVCLWLPPSSPLGEEEQLLLLVLVLVQQPALRLLLGFHSGGPGAAHQSPASLQGKRAE